MLPSLTDMAGPDARRRAGGKGVMLARLAQAGLAVPDAFVVEAAWFVQWQSVQRQASLPPSLSEELRVTAEGQLGDVAVAVRSSAVDEDQAHASFAGQYMTVLDVRGARAVEDAVLQCWRSALDARVAAYRAQQMDGSAEDSAMAVVVQRQLFPKVAGVAFTADPVTGDRTETVISAVRGRGERVVSGEAIADEWVVRGGVATCRVASEGALDSTSAVAISALARRVEDQLGHPVDIEWAMDSDGRLWLIQARPITALPEADVPWDAPGPGGWSRTFRFGEWLGEPLSPLAATWLVPTLDDRLWVQLDHHIGVPFRPRPSHAVVNGWFYASLNFWSVNPLRVIWTLFRRRSLWRLLAAIDPGHFPSTLDYWVPAWQQALPVHVRRVSDAEQRLDALSPAELIDIVDELVVAAGDYFVWIGILGGSAYKTEIPLAEFYQRHLASKIGGSHQQLLAALGNPPTPAPHAVSSLDWLHPTLGELADGLRDPSVEGDRSHFQDVQAQRERAEAAAHAALRLRPRLARRFSALLEAAQRTVRIREAVVEPFTLGWPAMRRALLSVGELLVNRGVLGKGEDVFFLTRQELWAATRSDAAAVDLRRSVADRREVWHRQRRLIAPPTLGHGWLMRGLGSIAERLRNRTTAMEDAQRVILSGLPASPGRVTATVRVIRSPDDFNQLQPGEVLVAPATTPAWSVLFTRAAAVVTDTGSPLAHTSLVAREFGIPAVVATGRATAQLRTGQVVTVDGSAGYVLRNTPVATP